VLGGLRGREQVLDTAPCDVHPVHRARDVGDGMLNSRERLPEREIDVHERVAIPEIAG
jgi:hypothetical protein